MFAEKEVEGLLKEILKESEFSGQVFSVGGFCRDEFLKIDSKDLDIVVSVKDGAKNLTQWLSNRFKGSVTNPHQMGAGYPIWQITFIDNIFLNGDTFHTKGAIVEFCDTMKESFPDSESRQREVEFGTLEDDIKRRDFTVNSLLRDLTTGELKDLAGSLNDIRQGILRCHPEMSMDKIFSDDPLRMIRLVRFQCKYDWKIPKSVLRSVRDNAHRIQIISAERIMGELEKVMKLGKLHKAIRLMKLVGLLEFIFPEIVELEKVEQHPKHHREGNVFIHTMLVLKNTKAGVISQMAALLHDVGKKATQEIKADNITFYGHEDVGAEIAEEILYRLKFDSKTIKDIKALVKLHMRPLVLRNAGEKALRKFLREHGEYLEMVLDLGEADCLGSIPNVGEPHNYLPELRLRFKEIAESPFQTTGKPVLNGQEVVELLAIKPSPIVGKVISFLKEKEEELATQKQQLTKEMAKELVLNNFKENSRE